VARVASYTRDADEVSLLINGVEWRFWSALVIQQSIDAYSTIAFAAPFEADRAEFRETFRPFSFQLLKVLLGGKDLFTGTLLDVVPDHSASESLVQVTGYGLPGVLADVNAPASEVPFEFDGWDLRRIATTIAEWYGLVVEFEAEEGAPFEKVALEPTTKPHEFLSDLALQRGLVMNDTPEGALRFWRSVEPGNPVAKFAARTPPVTTVSPSFNPRRYYSEITGYGKTKRDRDGSQYTEQNTRLSGVIRPHSFDLKDTEPADVPGAVRANMGRMFGEMAAYSIPELPTWRDPADRLWTHNTTIEITAPDVMIYHPTELLIRRVSLELEPDRKVAGLDVVLPGSYSGEIPEVLPWDG